MSDLVVAATYDGKYIDECLESLGNKYPVGVMDTSKGGYDTGAYLRAYREHQADNYFFMHDSMMALTPDYLEPFKALMPDLGAVAWAQFKEGFDTQAQHDLGAATYPVPYPGLGIFGPIFYTNRASLDKLKAEGFLPPVPQTKDEAMGMERLWPWAFAAAGMEVKSVAGLWNRAQMESGDFPVFRKIWGGRQ